MTRFPFSVIGIAAISALLAACASTRDADPATTTDHSGRMRGYVESSRVTDFCPDQDKRPDDARCIVTRGWDYSRGVTIVRTYDPQGKLIATEEPAGADLSLTEIEIARIEALMRADPRTRDTVNKPESCFGRWLVMREPVTSIATRAHAVSGLSQPPTAAIRRFCIRSSTDARRRSSIRTMYHPKRTLRILREL